MTLQNRQLKLIARPVGLPQTSDFSLETAPVGQPGEGEVLVKVHYLSLDPAMRGWMREGRSYLPPVELGAVMRAGGAGEVLESRDPAFRPGDFVVGMPGAQAYAVLPAAQLSRADPKLAPLPTWLGALGMPGLTAYFGLTEVGALKDGDTVAVSAAAGAVGSVAGQIAKLRGCKVVGIAGGPDKCAWVSGPLGFDACIDYKSEDVARRLRELCPKGIDVYFDNVGGDILDAALANLAYGARVVICGAISQYNATGPTRGPSNYMSLLVNRARMQGFLVFDYAARYREGVQALAGWMAEGKLRAVEDVEAGGLEAFVPTLNKLFSGANLGKLVLKL
jgi:NADPH-dependent curcumin reductase CurA